MKYLFYSKVLSLSRILSSQLRSFWRVSSILYLVTHHIPENIKISWTGTTLHKKRLFHALIAGDFCQWWRKEPYFWQYTSVPICLILLSQNHHGESSLLETRLTYWCYLPVWLSSKQINKMMDKGTKWGANVRRRKKRCGDKLPSLRGKHFKSFNAATKMFQRRCPPFLKKDKNGLGLQN